MTEQLRVIGRWAGHLLALAVLFVFLAAAEDSCGRELPPPLTPTPLALETPSIPSPAPPPTTVEAGDLADLGYLVEGSLLLDEGLRLLDDFSDWTDDTASQYEQGVMFPDTAAGELTAARWEDLVGRVESLDPPPAFQKSYGLFLAAHLEVLTGMELAVAGAEQFDPDLVEQGTAHMVEGARLMGLSTDALERGE